MADSDLKYTISSSYDGKGADAAAAQLKALKDQLDSLQNKKLQLTADSAQVTAEINRVKQQISTLNGQIKLGLDDADAMARLAELKAKLQELQDKKLAIRADASDLDVEISKVRLALASLPDKKTIKIDEDSSSARADLKDLKDQFDQTQKEIQDSWKRTQSAGTAATFSIATAIASLIVSMTPIAAAAISAGGAIVSGFGSAGLAAGAFGLSLRSTITSAQGMATNAYNLQMKIQQQEMALNSLTKGSASYNSMVNQIKVNQAALTQVMGQGTPVQNQLAVSILNLHMQWNNLQTIMEKATGPLIQSGIHVISSMMQAMVPLVVSVANALKPMMDQLVRFTSGGSSGITNSGFAKMIQWIEAVGVPNLQSAIQIAHNLIITVSQIFVAWGDSGTNMMNDMVRITAEIDKWGAGGGFARFQQQIQQNMPMIKQFFTALWEAIAKLTVSAYQFGPVGLSMLDIVLRLAAALPIQAVQALFVAFMAYKAVASTVAIFSAVGTAVKGIELGFKGAQVALASFKLAQEGTAAATDTLAASQMALTKATSEGKDATEANSAAQMLSKIGTIASAIADGIATAAQAAWNAAVAVFDVLISPLVLLIGGIVIAVAAVGFGIYELVTHWTTVWRDIKGAFVAAWDFMKGVFNEVVEFARGKWGIFVTAIPVVGWLIYIYANWQRILGDVKRYWDETWSAVKSAFDEAVSFLRGKFGILVTALPFVGWLLYIAANWQRIMGDIRHYFEDAVNGIKTAWDTVSNALKSAWDTTANALKSAWDTAWNGIKSSAQTVWDALKTAWDTVLNALKTAWDTVSSALTGAWNTVWNALKTAAQTVWDALKTAWDTIINGLKSTWDTVSSALSSAWSNIWNTMKSAANTVWSWITSTWNSITGTLKSTWDTISSSLSGAWSGFWNGLKGAVSQAKTDIGSIWDGIKAVFATPVNFVIGVWDTVADVIGVGHINPIPNEPGFFKLAEGGQVHGAGGPRDDKVPGWLSDKEFVLNADATQHWGLDALYALNNKQMPDTFGMASGGTIQRWPGFHLAGGDTGAGQTGATSTQGAQGAGTSASKTIVRTNLAGSGVFDSIMHGLTHPLSTLKNLAADVVYDVAKPILDSIVAAIPDPAPGFKTSTGGGGMPKAGGQKIEDSILAKLKSAQTTAKSVGGTIPTGNRLQVIVEALKADNVPITAWPEWEAGLNTLITRESGWSPNAVNNTDSNAKAGTPSTGLTQTIKPTFEAYRNKSLPDNMMDPVANIAAAINYINAVYGGIAHVQQANANMPPKGYDMGGALMPGLTLANNTTGVPEGVLNPTGLASIGGLSNLNMLNAGVSPTAKASTSATGGMGAAVVLNMPVTVNCTSTDPEGIIEQVEEDLLPKLTTLIKAGTR